MIFRAITLCSVLLASGAVRAAALSSQGEIRDVPEASHLIQFDRPDAVSDAVIGMVKRLR